MLILSIVNVLFSLGLGKFFFYPFGLILYFIVFYLQFHSSACLIKGIEYLILYSIIYWQINHFRLKNHLLLTELL